MSAPSAAIGTGFYTAGDAARLLGIPVRSIRRWLGGYSYKHDAEHVQVPPLWKPQLQTDDDTLELGFRDLIELRFVKEFISAGLAVQTIRRCLIHAQECVGASHPFSTQRFLTDGRTIFLNSVSPDDQETLLDLRQKQYVLKSVIERTFKDLDIEEGSVTRWRPFKGKPSIIIDPDLVFGQPTTAHYNIPTITLAQAVKAEGSEKLVSDLYEVPVQVVRDAVAYEEQLAA